MPYSSTKQSSHHSVQDSSPPSQPPSFTTKPPLNGADLENKDAAERKKKGTFVAASAPPPRGRRLHFCRRVVHCRPLRPSPPPQLPPPAAVLSPVRSPPSLPPSPLFNRFANDPRFKKRQFSSKKNRASSKGGCLHTGDLRLFRKLATRSLDRPPTDVEVFRDPHTQA
ncbi:hypothetical protein PIB30_001783 [Stylosanthes scabra]|uniref:Uncharacterized protein n=1 Tax=Stylosanthes scabra TaxID=79078 RepID=A0ABU6V1W8_9FABA|nr:hypothetical protein [Stylosanthes scabra]